MKDNFAATRFEKLCILIYEMPCVSCVCACGFVLQRRCLTASWLVVGWLCLASNWEALCVVVLLPCSARAMFEPAGLEEGERERGSSGGVLAEDSGDESPLA